MTLYTKHPNWYTCGGGGGGLVVVNAPLHA